MTQISQRQFEIVTAPAPRPAVELSVVLPAYDEADSLAALLANLFRVLDGMSCRFEVLVVNDGSKDRSIEVLRAVAARRPELRVIDFTRNYGQTAALMAGFDSARGDIIVTLDADLQNDPEDIPMLVAKIHEG